MQIEVSLYVVWMTTAVSVDCALSRKMMAWQWLVYAADVFLLSISFFWFHESVCVVQKFFQVWDNAATG